MKPASLFCRLGAVFLCLLIGAYGTAPALAAPAATEYYIYVNAQDGLGLYLRTGAGTEYSKVLPDPIPMYTCLPISRTDTSSTGAPWGYTSYAGVSGWVCLVETTTYDPTVRAPASADQTVYVNAKDGLGLYLRIGPGVEYAKVLPDPIPMYTRVHISQTDTSSTGALWGYTGYDGAFGWVCLVETTSYDPRAEDIPADTPTVVQPAQQTDIPAPSSQGEAASLNTLLVGVGIGLLAAILIVLVVLAVVRKK